MKKRNNANKTKTFFNLPIISGGGIPANVRNYLAAILTMGLWYFIFAVLGGLIIHSSFDFYIQQEDKNYIDQAFLLLGAFIMNFPSRGLLNYLGDKFFINKHSDKFVYPLILIVIYFTINEILGF